LLNLGSVAEYTAAVDIWAVGCIMHEMITGDICFGRAKNDTDLKELHGDFKYKPLKRLDEDGNDLLQRLLCLNPTKRLTAQQALQHPWFGGGGVEVAIFAAAAETNAALQLPPDITERMRTVLIEWFHDIAAEQEISRDTIHLAVAYVDSVLSSQEANIKMCKLQLLGVACLDLATKMHEMYGLGELYCVTLCDSAYTRGEFKTMQKFVVAESLKWNLIRKTGLGIAFDLFKMVPDVQMCNDIKMCTDCPSTRMHKWDRVAEAMDYLLLDGWMLTPLDRAAVAICYAFGPWVLKHLCLGNNTNNLDTKSVLKWRRMIPKLPHLDKNQCLCNSVLQMQMNRSD
jgi:Serine/threonine protein kinase